MYAFHRTPSMTGSLRRLTLEPSGLRLYWDLPLTATKRWAADQLMLERRPLSLCKFQNTGQSCFGLDFLAAKEKVTLKSSLDDTNHCKDTEVPGVAMNRGHSRVQLLPAVRAYFLPPCPQLSSHSSTLRALHTSRPS